MKSGLLKAIFVLLSLLYLSRTYGQDSTSFQEILGDTLVKKGQTFYFSNNIDSALFYCEKSAEQFKAAEVWEKYIGALNDISYINYNTKEYIKFEAAALKAHEESLLYLNANSLYRITAFNNLYAHYYSLGDHNKAITICKEVLSLNTKNNAETSEIISSYLNLGNSFRFTGDYNNAVSFMKKALKIQQDTFPDDPEIADTYRDIGRVFRINNQIDSAAFYFEKAAQLLEPVKKNNPLSKIKTNNYLSLAELWIDNQDITTANAYVRKAANFVPNDFYQIRLDEVRGKILFNQGKYPQAIRSIKKAMDLARSTKKRNTLPYQARRLMELAKIYETSDDLEAALTNYQNALKVLSPNFESDLFQDNPEVSQLLDKPDALKILNNKARILYQYYTAQQKQTQLIAAYQTYLSATNLIKDFRQGIQTAESKSTLSEKNIEIYEGAIHCALELYTQTGEDSYKETAFYLAERNKALLLLESINEQSAKNFAGIPDSLLEQEKDLKLNITYFQKLSLENKSKNLSTQTIEENLFDLQQSLNTLTDNLEKTYPRYYDLKYRNEPSKISEIQQSLQASNKAFLEYFVGENDIYLFVLTSENLEIRKLENETLIRQQVETLRNLINQAPDAGFGMSEYNTLTTSANELYLQLIKPIVDQLHPDITDWVIIPDYYLNYIPFDILLRQQATAGKQSLSPKKLAYLFEDYNISYDYSITLHLKNQNRPKQNFKRTFAGFAPAFKTIDQAGSSRTCTKDELFALQCSEEEVGSIAALMGGQKFLGKAANRMSFETEVKDYKIIHLATHACIDEQDSKLNKIFLTDDYLSDSDLYNMELHAELAVLSACNTGSGKLIKGEGVMSLARGFINAGCSSTLISMWSVDDCATSDIMFNFYEGIKAGLTKEKALKAAKLKYLETVDKAKMHPYYWAAFLPFGEMEAIEMKTNAFKWYYPLAGIALLFLGYFFFFRKK